MSGKQEGTYPRRLIKRTHNRNPTFHSFNLFGVLQPDPLPADPAPLKQPARPPYSFATITAGDVSPHKKSFLQSYLPDHRNQYLAERGQKSLSRIEGLEYSLGTPRAKSTSKIEVDSLHQAEDEFIKNKLRNPEYFVSGSSFRAEGKPQPRVVLDFSPNLQKQQSIKRCQSIVEKQKIDYNIISNMSRT